MSSKMYQPTKHAGVTHAYSRTYPDYSYGAETYQHNPQRYPERFTEPSYSDGYSTSFRCPVAGPSCVGAFCHQSTGNWICPSTPAEPQPRVCQRVISGDTWSWKCET